MSSDSDWNVTAILDKHGFAKSWMLKRIRPCEPQRAFVLLEPSEDPRSLRECVVVGEVRFEPTRVCRFGFSLAVVRVGGEKRLVSKDRVHFGSVRRKDGRRRVVV